jgi:hypothetical protein
MILHAVTFAAFLVNEVSPAPIMVQCAPNAAQDPFWSRLLVTAIPSVLALGIAWMAFHWNSQKDQKRWTLDNKKAEWKELLEFASAIEQFLPSVAIGQELTDTLHDQSFKKHLRDMTQASLKCVFIPADKAMKIYELLVTAQLTNEESKGQIEDFRSNASHTRVPDFPRPLQAAKKVQSALIDTWQEIRRLASEDLELEQGRPWRKLLANWAKKVPGIQTGKSVSSI